MRSFFAVAVVLISAFALSFAADLLFGAFAGVYPASAYLPVVTWSLVATVLAFIAFAIAKQPKVLAWPIAAFAVVVLLAAILGTHPHSYAVAATLFAAAAVIWSVFSFSPPNLIDAFTPSELQRWLSLRALEWSNWPAFLSQAVVPLLLPILPWYSVILGVCLLEVAWLPLRYHFVNIALARAAVLFVSFTKWLAAFGVAGYFAYHRSYGLAALSLFWPLVAGFLQFPAQVGRIELRLANQLGLTVAVQSDSPVPESAT